MAPDNRSEWAHLVQQTWRLKDINKYKWLQTLREFVRYRIKFKISVAIQNKLDKVCFHFGLGRLHSLFSIPYFWFIAYFFKLILIPHFSTVLFNWNTFYPLSFPTVILYPFYLSRHSLLFTCIPYPLQPPFCAFIQI